MNLPDLDTEGLTGSKVVRTFRMPQELVNRLGREAHLRGLDLTALVLRILQGFLTYYSLPEAAIAQLEADRESMKMDRNQYLSHILYHRCLALRERGYGFDDPHAPRLPAPEAEPCGTTVPELPPTLTKGALGGGAHGVGNGLVPGAGVWPWGVKENAGRKR